MVLVIVGGLNWGLVAVSPSWNLVEMLVGAWPVVAQLVYLLVGVAAVYLAVVMRKFHRM